MPYSRAFQNYSGANYNTQQPWDEIDYTNLQPAIRDFGRTPKEPEYQSFNIVDPICQDVGSPNFSQFFNLDCSDVGSFSVPSEEISPEPFYRTSPSSIDLSRQSTLSSLKLEPGSAPGATFECPAYELNQGDNEMQPTGLEPACFQSASLVEIEDCNAAAPCSPTGVPPAANRKPTKRTPARRPSTETRSSQRQTKERDPKSRVKRSHTGSESEDETAQIRAKQAHSVVERRYRDNLNGKIMQLHHALATTDAFSRSTGLPNQDFYASREHRGKVRKSDVMTDAMNYVHQSEVEIRHMTDEIARLSDRVVALEKLVKCEDCTLLKQMVRLQLQRQASQ